MVPGSSAARIYWREIAAVLLAKTLALAVLYLLFFSSAPQPVDVGHLFEQGRMP